MKRGLFRFTVLVLFCAEATALAHCLEVSPSKFREILKERKTKQVVFFSSWCASCREHMTSLTKDDVLVGVFDESERLDKMAARLAPKATCYRGEELAKEFKVVALPATRTFNSH